MHFVYLLKSDLGYAYIGQIKNLEDRLKRHNSNRNTSIRYKGRWELISYKSTKSRIEAISLNNN